MFDAHTGSSPASLQLVGHTHSPASHTAPYLHFTSRHKSTSGVCVSDVESKFQCHLPQSPLYETTMYCFFLQEALRRSHSFAYVSPSVPHTAPSASCLYEKHINAVFR